MQWLDRWLRDVDNGADRDPKVMIYVKGANRWRYEDDWPLADAKPAELRLAGAPSGTVGSVNDGTLVPAEAARAARPGPAKLGYDPSSGPFLAAMLSTPGRLTADRRGDEEKALTWTSAPLTVATEVTGYPKLTLFAASSAPDADLVAEISDVAPDGTSRQVVQGYMNAPRLLDRAAPKPLTPGQVNRYDLETYATAYVFRPGHRIRLTLAGGAKLAPGQLLPQGPGANPTPFELTIHQDEQYPSALVLPVVGTGDEALRAAATR